MGAELNWSTYKKEAFAIFKKFERMDYFVCGTQLVHVFTDHGDLLILFAPMALHPNTQRHVLVKVHRCTIYLSRFQFSIEHIDGKDNVGADMLT